MHPLTFKTHKYSHTGERPFVCEHPGCGASFVWLNSLRYHRLSHIRERPYLCTYPKCRACFSRKSVLKTHLLTHSKEKPYVCCHPGCSASFTQKQRLIDHSFIHSEKNLFSANILAARPHSFRSIDYGITSIITLGSDRIRVIFPDVTHRL